VSSIEEEILRQSHYMPGNNWLVCGDCKNYKGACACEKNVFIAFEGANMSNCSFYDKGKKCPHCGRVF